MKVETHRLDRPTSPTTSSPPNGPDRPHPTPTSAPGGDKK